MPTNIRTRKGRPPVLPEDRLSAIITVRVTPSELLAITQKYRSLGLCSQSAYFRTILLEGSNAVRARVPKCNLETASSIAGIAGSFERLLAFSEQKCPTPLQLAQMADHLHFVMQNVIRELRGGSR